ncbi:hypothetical protein OIO90_001594 [Microbotryomycetes sp. JL221]|nr:hypothetical protein OIO90_001594 [Microbotryomycetes sp. JL221]
MLSTAPIATANGHKTSEAPSEQPASMADEDAAIAEAALIERKKMLAGEAYDAAKDPGLIEGRLRARKYLHMYNHHPPAEHRKGMNPIDFFGPDSRFQILADLFMIELADAKKLAIEPPFYCDYGDNIKFKGECYMNFGCTVLGKSEA